MDIKEFESKVNYIKRRSQNEIKFFLKEQIYNIQYKLEYSYKNKNRFEYLSSLASLIPYYIQDINNSLHIFKLLIMINKCMHGQKILVKYYNYINMMSNENIINIIHASSESWTFPIFLYYICILKARNITNLYDRILSDSFYNTDDRIYQAIIKDKHLYELFDFTKDNNIKNIIYNIFICNDSKENKYKLRKLRYLNSIIPNLINYSYYIINACCSRSNISLVSSILKYYYKELSINEIDLFVDILINSDNTDIIKTYNDVYNILKTDNEKNILVICMLLHSGCSYGKKIINGDLYFNNYEILISQLLSNMLVLNDPITFINKNDFTNFINSFSMNYISKCININMSLNKLMYLLPYVVLSIGPYAKQFNMVRYCIHKFIKNIRNKKKMITKLKLYPILNELNNLKSTSNKPVLSSNSYLLSQINQRFNTIPPYHLFPGQLQNMDNNKHFLLKEKADGVLLNSIPKDIMPNPNGLLDSKLKVEYIEKLDLYLVFDIDNHALRMNSIIDRHNYIHSLHKYGQKDIPLINNLEEMIDNINYERNKLKKFLTEDYDNYRWYPKPAWYINNIANFIEPFTDLVNMKNSIDEWVINDNYNDGLILTPLDGSREIKIKPKKFYTIDLVYSNNKWLDRENNEWDVIEECIDCELINNTIWRCYYNINNNLVAKEIRHDKTKPNTNKVATLINALYFTEYKYIKYENVYYETPPLNNIFWNNIVKSNINMMKKLFSNIKPNSNIIDFGCGSGKSLMYLNNLIKDYTYTGLDKDINMICKAINKYSISDNIMFAYKNLPNTSFDIARSAEEKNNWINLNKNYYDIVLMINSLMHFSTDYFWEELKSITKKSSLILFNLVSMENNDRYEFDKFFIERKDNKVYYKFPIHNNIKEESYIDINDILKRGYEIVNSFQSKEDNLTKYYKWYVIKHI